MKKIIHIFSGILFLSFIFESYVKGNLIHEKVFTNIFYSGGWGGKESVSGYGSDLYATEVIRKVLPKLLKALQVKTFLDAPCGDFWWMKDVDLSMLDRYIGMDIVEPLIRKNNLKYQKTNKTFIAGNIVEASLPKVDCIMCRDCLVHLKFADAIQAIRNFKSSGAKYLLLTTFPCIEENHELKNTGDWRALNFELPPFNLPKPRFVIKDQFKGTHKFDDKKLMGLWLLDDINL